MVSESPKLGTCQPTRGGPAQAIGAVGADVHMGHRLYHSGHRRATPGLQFAGLIIWRAGRRTRCIFYLGAAQRRKAFCPSGHPRPTQASAFGITVRTREPYWKQRQAPRVRPRALPLQRQDGPIATHAVINRRREVGLADPILESTEYSCRDRPVA